MSQESQETRESQEKIYPLGTYQRFGLSHHRGVPVISVYVTRVTRATRVTRENIHHMCVMTVCVCVMSVFKWVAYFAGISVILVYPVK
jgi:hypothetical protein